MKYMIFVHKSKTINKQLEWLYVHLHILKTKQFIHDIFIQIGFRTKCQIIPRQNPTRHIYINIYCKVYKGWLEKKIQDIWKHIVRINSNIVFDISK